MTKNELTKFRGLLNARTTELEQGVRRRDGIEVERTADVMDEVQFAAARELTTRRIDRDSKTLRDVRAALIRIDDGTYGICLSCDEEIAPRRLNAVPWAPLCFKCQEQEDRRHSVGSEPVYFADAA